MPFVIGLSPFTIGVIAPVWGYVPHYWIITLAMGFAASRWWWELQVNLNLCQYGDPYKINKMADLFKILFERQVDCSGIAGNLMDE